MNGQKIPLLKVKQWLNSWEQSIWSPDEGLPKPPQNFYIASMPLKLLRNLAGVSRRQIEERKRLKRGRVISALTKQAGREALLVIFNLAIHFPIRPD